MAQMITIFMPLLNEGTDVWRPVNAERLGPDTFQVIGPEPDHEEWMFTPGTIVRAIAKQFDDGKEGIVAIALST
jgi:hypothetical protein